MQSTVKQVTLDYEWVSLIKKAKTMGITLEEVREFLEEAEKAGDG
jgi:DNA-binding transcriptional MerR regulator